MHNSRQILDIVAATFGGAVELEVSDPEDCSATMSPAESLACEWLGIRRRSENLGFQQEDQVLSWLADMSKVRPPRSSFQAGANIANSGLGMRSPS